MDFDFEHTNLAAVLSGRGITYERDEQTAADQRMTWRAKNGTVIGRFNVCEGWEWVHTSCRSCGGTGEDQNKLNDPGPCPTCNGGTT